MSYRYSSSSDGSGCGCAGALIFLLVWLGLGAIVANWTRRSINFLVHWQDPVAMEEGYDVGFWLAALAAIFGPCVIFFNIVCEIIRSVVW